MAAGRAETEAWLATYELVGRPLDDSRTDAEGAGFSLRVVADNRSSGPIALTADRRFDRINVTTVDGLVVGIDGVY